MLTIEEIIKNEQKQSNIWLQKMAQIKNGEIHYSSNFHHYHLLLGIYAISQKKYQEAKRHFNLCALIDEFGVKYHNKRFRFFDYSIYSVCFALLCDNKETIKRYSKLRYPSFGKMSSMDERVLKGEAPIWCNTIQLLLANDIDTLKRNLHILKTSTLKKLTKNEELLKTDFEFYKALYANDKSRCEAVLEQLVSPKIHKKRNDDPLLGKYVSQPALGYAKLAWMRGLEVEVKSPLVPKELLPVKPNESYKIPYDFLKNTEIM